LIHFRANPVITCRRVGFPPAPFCSGKELRMVAERERLTSLIDYVEATERDRLSIALDVADHRGFRRNGDDLIKLPGVAVNLVGTDDSIWLSVDRLSRCPAPVPGDAELRAWLDSVDDPAKPPTLKAELSRALLEGLGFLPADAPEEGPVQLADHPGKARIEAALGAYRREVWTPWVEEERPRRQAIELYNGLFSLRQMLDGAGEQPIELVWGVGPAQWTRPRGTLRYPLLTLPVELALNEATHAIEVRPRLETAPGLESDPLDLLDAQGVNEWVGYARTYLETLPGDGLSPFEPDGFTPLLRRAVALLDPDGCYLPDLGERPVLTGDTLRVDAGWLLFERPRRATHLMDDLRRFRAAVQQVAAPEDLPEAVRVLLQPPGEAPAHVQPHLRGVSTIPGVTTSDGSGADLFFPKPFNREQVEVIQRLAARPGVVVQGPPGTGKTHTIANIISHYLALGKRVLVTSQKAPPLKVLRDKLPEAVRPLAVSLLESDRDGLKQFQQSVDIIAERLQRTRPDEVRRQIASLDVRIDGLHRGLAQIDRQVDEIGRGSMTAVDVDGVRHEPAAAARTLVEAGALASWLPDRIDAIASHEPEFDEDLIAALRGARKRVGTRLDALGIEPPPADLPSAGEMLALHDALIEAETLRRATPPGAGLRDGSTAEAVTTLAAKLGALSNAGQEVQATAFAWTKDALARLRADREDAALGALAGLSHDVGALNEQARHFLVRPVALADGAVVDSDFREAVTALARGEDLGLFRNLFARQVKAQLSAVRIAARAPATVADWMEIDRYLSAIDRADGLRAAWNNAATHAGLDPVDAPGLAAGDPMRRQLAQLTRLRALVDQENIVEAEVRSLLPGWRKRVGADPAAATELAAVLDQHVRRARLAEAETGLARLCERIADVKGPIGEALRSVAGEIGDETGDRDALDRRWSGALDEAATLRGLLPAFATIGDVTHHIDENGAPAWAEQLRTVPVEGLEDPLTPGDWRTRWTLRQLSTWLDRIDRHDRLRSLGRERTEHEQQLQRAYEEAIELRTWCRLAEQANDQVRSALAAYAQAMRKLGRGTGIRAGRYRADARAAADRAKNALPCWIMPHYRVSESLPAELGLFDLVIVDEASQSTVAALPALLRAKQVLIVGDDRQVSPDAGFREEARLNALAERHLSGQVPDFRAALREDRSLYDLGTVVFAGGAILLKEHFRCVSPIIEYSKAQFYSHQLIPLRLPSASERLDPPLVDILVEDGHRRGKVNPPEVDCIVDEIGRIAADPTMARRTIGVTTLLGQEQAIQILEGIERSLGSEVMIRHDIRVGEPAAFQGDEREIMFVSLVADRDSGVVSGLAFEQRFNVAASRARDRMILVRSVELEDLRPADKLRRSLIEHFHAPFAAEGSQVADRRARCESPFETEMFDLLAERGYRTDTQVRVGTKRIDLVVEGADDRRLAIACDGDAYHGPEQWPDDMARQRMLERAGWTVWRCFASRFVRERNAVVDELIGILDARGIAPERGDALPPSRHCEHRRWRSTPPEADGPDVPYAWLVCADPF
jgi:very-short-patch-repair endonuclease